MRLDPAASIPLPVPEPVPAAPHHPPVRLMLPPLAPWAATAAVLGFGVWAQAGSQAAGDTSVTGLGAIGIGVLNLVYLVVSRKFDKDSAVREAEQRFAMQTLQSAFDHLQVNQGEAIRERDAAERRAAEADRRAEAAERRSITLEARLEIAEARLDAYLQGDGSSTDLRRRDPGSSSTIGPKPGH